MNRKTAVPGARKGGSRPLFGQNLVSAYAGSAPFMPRYAETARAGTKKNLPSATCGRKVLYHEKLCAKKRREHSCIVVQARGKVTKRLFCRALGSRRMRSERVLPRPAQTRPGLLHRGKRCATSERHCACRGRISESPRKILPRRLRCCALPRGTGEDRASALTETRAIARKRRTRPIREHPFRRRKPQKRDNGAPYLSDRGREPTELDLSLRMRPGGIEQQRGVIVIWHVPAAV